MHGRVGTGSMGDRFDRWNFLEMLLTSHIADEREQAV
jgi:hypothetical protein